MATKINRKLNGTDSIEKELGDLIDSGGTIGGQLYIKDGLTIRDSTQASFCGDTKVYRNNAIGGTFGIELKARLNSSNYGSVAIGGDIGTWSALMPTMSNMNLGKEDMPWSTLYLGNSYKNVNGCTSLPNGLILQWGVATITGGINGMQINFPMQFPNSVLSLSATIVDNAKGTTSVQTWITGKNTSNFYVRTNEASSINWIALGY